MPVEDDEDEKLEKERAKKERRRKSIQNKEYEVKTVEQEDVGEKYTHPVFLKSQSEYSEPLTAYGACLLFKAGCEGEYEVSVCAVCARDESEDYIMLPHPAPQQLHLYCGTAVISDDDVSIAPLDSVSGLRSSQRVGGDRKGRDVKATPLPMISLLNLGSSVYSFSSHAARCSLVLPCGVILVNLRDAVPVAGALRRAREAGPARGRPHAQVNCCINYSLIIS